MLRKFVTVRNISDNPQTIYDRRLSHGRLTLQPGEEFDLASDIYQCNFRRLSRWMKPVVPYVAAPKDTVEEIPPPKARKRRKTRKSARKPPEESDETTSEG